jgi:hypothetical protein
MAIERELQQKKADMEERQRENEARAEEARAKRATDEELKQMREQSLVRGMVTMAARADNVAAMRRTRATLASEAGQLSRDIGNSYGPAVIYEGPGHTETLWTNVGHANPEDFRNRHLRTLQSGMARLDTAILSETASLNRDATAIQESQQRLAEEEDGNKIDEEV